MTKDALRFGTLCTMCVCGGYSYKYSNGSPGVRPSSTFGPTYTPAPIVKRMQVGTPPVLQLTALEDALKVRDKTAMAEIRAASITLCDLLIAHVERLCPELILINPHDGQSSLSKRQSPDVTSFIWIYLLIKNRILMCVSAL